MIVRILLALAALLLVGCNAPTQVWAARGSLDDAADVAVDAWNDALAEHCPQHAGLVRTDSRTESDVQVAWGVHPDAADAAGSETGSHIVVAPRMQGQSVDELAYIVAHEIGHALGASHDDRSWLMRPHANLREGLVPRISKADVDQVCGRPEGTL